MGRCVLLDVQSKRLVYNRIQYQTPCVCVSVCISCFTKCSTYISTRSSLLCVYVVHFFGSILYSNSGMLAHHLGMALFIIMEYCTSISSFRRVLLLQSNRPLNRKLSNNTHP